MSPVITKLNKLINPVSYLQINLRKSECKDAMDIKPVDLHLTSLY